MSAEASNTWKASSFRVHNNVSTVLKRPSRHALLIESPVQASAWLAEKRRQQQSIGFVPTMGALHDGHLSLVAAAAECDIICASIFVNPLQFNNSEDLERYPRNPERDIELLTDSGCDMVFTGTLQSFFPGVADTGAVPLEDPGAYAQGLEGEYRPGHFAGVRTIVKRLFETVGDCRAYFGEKDFQQCLVIKDLAAALGYPHVIVCPTRREPHGLAMSSRNERLSPEQRRLAGSIYQALASARDAWQAGERSPEKLEEIMTGILDRPGIVIEYAALRDPLDWIRPALPNPLVQPPRALVAVMIGDVRLIDNLALG